MKQRIALLVYVDLDPIPGAFHTERSARDQVAGILDHMVGLYNPIVSYAPDDVQPPNRPKPIDDSQEILRPASQTPLSIQNAVEEPLAGSAPENNGVLTTADLSTDYTEGYR